MPLDGFPRRVSRRPQTIACEDALVQPSEFFDDQGLHCGLLLLRHTCRHGSPNVGERVKSRMCDDFPKGLLDEVTPSQAKGVGFNQILLDRQIFLR